MALKAKTSRRDTEAKKKAMEQVNVESVKRLNTEIPASLHKQLKIRAVQDDTSITEIVVDAIVSYLKQ